MPTPTAEIGSDDQIPEHLNRTIDAMATISRQTAALLKRVDTISDQLSRLNPGKPAAPAERGDRQEGEGEAIAIAVEPPAADQPPSPVQAEQRAKPASESANAADALLEQQANRVVQIVMDKIQPLLGALEKIRHEQSGSRQLTENEYVTKMCDDMGKRIAARRGFLTRLQHKESQS